MLQKSHQIILNIFLISAAVLLFLFLWKTPFVTSANAASHKNITTGKQITDRVKKVKKKNVYLPHTTIKVKKAINPWNFTITLSSSRILLKKEVAKSKIVLFPKKKKSLKITASFAKLSKNGRKLTYQIPASGQHLLCPGNSSRNGTYFIKSSLFPKRLSMKYTERLTKQTISGFVLQQTGKPIANAYVHLKTASKVLTCHTDQNGHYKIKNAKKPISLTVTKSGYHKSTISSLKTSKKGTICENMILKPTKNTSRSIDFLITDTGNQPLQNATVQIFPAAKRLSSKKTEFSSCLDSFSKEDQLLCAKSNANGKLSFTNFKNRKTVSCTKMVLEETLQLSYADSYSPDLSNRKAIGNKINTEGNYIIYVSNPAAQNNSPESYYTAKLTFSFSYLHTNHLFIHVKLKKAPMVNTKYLSVKWDSAFDSSSCDSLDLSIYHKNEQKPFYRTTLERNAFVFNEDTLILPSVLSVSLPEDTYYIRLCAQSKEETVIGASPVKAVSVKNGYLLPCQLQLQASCYSRILTLHETEKEVTAATFSLYQILDNMYFFIDNFTTEPFIWSSYHMQTANLITVGMVRDGQYLLYPASDNIIAKSNPTITPEESRLWKTSEEAMLSVPLCQISCQSAGFGQQAASTPFRFSSQTFDIIHSRQYTLNQTMLRKSPTYPNTVLAFYRKNGTLLTISLTASGSDLSAFLIPKHSVLDLYRNNEILTTSQDSYQKK